MKCVDFVKPPARTNLEAWYRWMNWTQTRLVTLISSRKRIKIEQANEQDWEFVFVKSNGKKVMTVF